MEYVGRPEKPNMPGWKRFDRPSCENMLVASYSIRAVFVQYGTKPWQLHPALFD